MKKVTYQGHTGLQPPAAPSPAAADTPHARAGSLVEPLGHDRVVVPEAGATPAPTPAPKPSPSIGNKA